MSRPHQRDAATGKRKRNDFSGKRQRSKASGACCGCARCESLGSACGGCCETPSYYTLSYVGVTYITSCCNFGGGSGSGYVVTPPTGTYDVQFVGIGIPCGWRNTGPSAEDTLVRLYSTSDCSGTVVPSTGHGIAIDIAALVMSVESLLGNLPIFDGSAAISDCCDTIEISNTLTISPCDGGGNTNIGAGGSVVITPCG